MDHTRKRFYYKRKKATQNPNLSNTPDKTQFNKPVLRENPQSLNIVRNNQMISVVIPLINEEESLNELSSELEKVFDF